MRQSAELMRRLYDHESPEIRNSVRAAIVKAYPQTRSAMPDQEVREAGAETLEAIRKERADFLKEQQAAKNAADQAAWRGKLRQGFRAPNGQFLKVAEDDIPKIEKLMVDRAIGDPETAAFVYSAEQEVARPRGAGRESYGIVIPGSKGSGEFFSKTASGGPGLMEAPDQWTRERAHEIWQDVTSGDPSRREQWMN